MKQPKLNMYGKGIHKTPAGHLRYHSPKELRHQYVHRKVVEDLIKVTHPLTLQVLHWPYEVHHIDENKENNSPENLMLLDGAFHSSITMRSIRAKFEPRWKTAPEWVMFEGDDGVPF